MNQSFLGAITREWKFPMDSFEKEAISKGFRTICGVDEAGRGPLAGPVVSAAVVFHNPPLGLGIKDSKALTPKKRERLFFEIYREASAVGIGIVWSEEVDGLNIHRATLKSMRKAVESLGIKPDFILIDGIHGIDSLDCPQKAIVSGDSLSVSIAAASIIAKVTRDNVMTAYHRVYPDYNFMENKGYGTPRHMAALHRIGPSPIHRRSFRYKRSPDE